MYMYVLYAHSYDSCMDELNVHLVFSYKRVAGACLCECAPAHACKYMFVSTYVRTCMHMLICMYIRMLLYIQTHLCIHTYTNMSVYGCNS